MRNLAVAVTLAFALSSPIPAHAQVWDNGVPDYYDGYNISQWLFADNFSFTSLTTVRWFRAWGLEVPAWHGTWSGSLYWEIYSGGSGGPSSLVATGLSAGRSLYHTYLYGGTTPWNFYEHNVNIGSLPLAAGDYWLVLHDGATNTIPTNSYFWATSDDFSGTARGDYNPFDGTWSPYNVELAFQLYDTEFPGTGVVPEPSTVILLGTGLLGIGFVAWRRKEEN
jgi:hypothetical protein